MKSWKKVTNMVKVASLCSFFFYSAAQSVFAGVFQDQLDRTATHMTVEKLLGSDYTYRIPRMDRDEALLKAFQEEMKAVGRKSQKELEGLHEETMIKLAARCEDFQSNSQKWGLVEGALSVSVAGSITSISATNFTSTYLHMHIIGDLFLGLGMSLSDIVLLDRVWSNLSKSYFIPKNAVSVVDEAFTVLLEKREKFDDLRNLKDFYDTVSHMRSIQAIGNNAPLSVQDLAKSIVIFADNDITFCPIK